MASTIRAERRRHRRCPFVRRIICSLSAGDEESATWPAVALDLSEGGVRLAVAQELTVGDILRIRLGTGDQADDIAVARVVRIGAGSPGEWVVGCEFLEPGALQERSALRRNSELFRRARGGRP